MDRPWRLREVADDLTQQMQQTVHVGALVPWANLAMEAELPFIFPGRMVWHFARLVPPSQTTEIDTDFLQGMIEAIPPATFAFSRLPLDVLVFGCTSASFSYSELVAGRLQAASTTRPFLTAFTAIEHVLHYFDARRIVLLTPYEGTITQAEVQAFTESGIEVLGASALGYRDGIGDIETDALLAAYRSCRVPEAQAIVISCTALHTLEAIRLLEAQAGVPVISSNTALALASALLYTGRIMHKE
jgi:maleate isomerase